MKKPKLFCLCLLFLTGMFVLSCSQYDEPETYTFDEGGLDAVGRVFMDIVKTRPDWEREWTGISQTGTPLPDEVVNMSDLASGNHFCVLPILRGKEITGLVYYPFEMSKNEKAGRYMKLGAPEIIHKDSADTSGLARVWLQLGVLDRLKIKGYTSSLKLSPETELPKTGVITRSQVPPIIYGYVNCHFSCWVTYEVDSTYEEACRALALTANTTTISPNGNAYSLSESLSTAGLVLRVDNVMDLELWLLEYDAQYFIDELYTCLYAVPGILGVNIPYHVEPMDAGIGGGTPPPPAGGGTPPPGPSTNPTVTDPRFNFGANLTDIERQALIDAIEENIAAKILEKLEDEPVNIEYDPTLSVPGAYDPDTNTIILRDIASVGSATLNEEFFHAFQDRVYHGVLANLVSPRATGFTNMEFEAKLYRDIDWAFDLGWLSSTMTIDNFDNDAYQRYINCLSEATHNWDDTQPIDWNRIGQAYDDLIRKFADNDYSSYPPCFPVENNTLEYNSCDYR